MPNKIERRKKYKAKIVNITYTEIKYCRNSYKLNTESKGEGTVSLGKIPTLAPKKMFLNSNKFHENQINILCIFYVF